MQFIHFIMLGNNVNYNIITKLSLSVLLILHYSLLDIRYTRYHV